MFLSTVELICALADRKSTVNRWMDDAKWYGGLCAAFHGLALTCVGELVSPDGQSSYPTVEQAAEAILGSYSSDDDDEGVTREQLHNVAQLRRHVAQASMPYRDGPVVVLSFGSIVPEKEYFTQKKIYPVGYRTLALYRNAQQQVFQFICGT